MAKPEYGSCLKVGQRRIVLDRGLSLGFPDKHLDVLQNIEFAIVSVYRRSSGMSDYNVMRALDALISIYKAESRGHTPKVVALENPDQEVFDSVKAMCEWRMGRADPGELAHVSPDLEKNVDEVLDCLKKIRKSVDKWSKRGGPEGYLSFVSPYV